jgi:AcrR family transcriptional regulator
MLDGARVHHDAKILPKVFLLSTAAGDILSCVAVHDQPLSRRDRKTQRTRREIVRAASELVLEGGYERATIARIADRADLATRTVTTRFASKEAIFLEEVDEAVERAEQHLGAQDGDAIDRLRAWIDELAAREPQDREIRLLRSRAVAHDPDLRALWIQHFNQAHTAIARAVAADTVQSPDAAGPQMIGAAAVAMLRVLERLAAEQSDQALAELDRGFRVLRGALDALLT